MKKIIDLIDNVNEELESASNYAEKYVELKASGETHTDSYYEMAYDELKHAEQIYTFAIEETKKIEKVYCLPVDITRLWDITHKRYAEKSALIKQMLKA